MMRDLLYQHAIVTKSGTWNNNTKQNIIYARTELPISNYLLS